MSTQKIEVQKKLSIIDFYQCLLKEDKEITENYLLWNSCPFTLSSEDKKNLMDALNKKTKLDTERSLFEKKLKEFNVSTETVSFSEYEKILPLSRLAYAFEKNGEAEAHAFKLILLFGSKAAVLDYLKKFERDNPGLTQIIHEACIFPLPEGDKWNIKIWRELSIKYMPDNRYNRVLGRAIEIENYINKEKEKIEKEIDEQVDRDWKETFEKRFLEIMASDLSEESKYISTKLEKLNSKVNASINKRFDFYIREEIIQNSIIKKLSADEIKKITEYKNSSSGIEKLKQIKEEVIIEFKNTLKKEYQQSKNCFNLDKKTYIEKCFQENQKIITNEKRLSKKDIFSENTGLDFLLNLNANCSYKRANEHLAAAKLFLQQGLRESSFELYLSLKKQDSDLIPPLLNNDEIPILIEGKEIGYPGFYLTKLSPENPKCAVLGKLTSCCQHLEGEGRNCAVHAISSEQGGLYVLCSYKKNAPSHEDTIIAQCWAWRSKNGAIVFDSVEILVHLRKKYEIMISDFFTYLGHKLVTQYNIPRVLVGVGGVTPPTLGTLQPLEAEFPIDYNKYRDSHNQKIIADRLLPFVQLYITSTKEKGSNLSIKSINENISTSKKLIQEDVEKNTIALSEWREILNKRNYAGANVLFQAACDGNFALVEALLKEKVDATIQDNEGNTALMLACKNGNPSMIRTLLKAGMDTINFQNNSGYSALLYACESSDAETVELLLKSGANTFTNEKEWPYQINPKKTALMYAAEKENAEMVSSLLNYGAKSTINHKNTAGTSALMYGVGNNLIVSTLLKNGATINHANDSKITELMYAAMNGNVKSIVILLEAGAEPNKIDQDGKSALMYAAYFNKTEAFFTLLKYANSNSLNDQDTSGETVLMYSAQKNNKEILEQLIASKIEINIKDKLGMTALTHAIEDGRELVIERLLKAGADHSFEDNLCRTPLMIATLREKTEIVSTLIKMGANVNFKTKAGITALMYAASWNRIKIIPILLQANADLYIKDYHGSTALTFALNNKSSESITLLENVHAMEDKRLILQFRSLNPLSSYFKDEQPDTAEPFYCKLRSKIE